MNLPKAAALAGLRIFVVDDDDDVRDLLVTVLELSGAEVQAAADARSAVPLCQAFAPDLLLSDMCMPGGSGCSLLQSLRSPATPGAAGVRPAAIAISAFAGSEHEALALAAGFQAFLTKPIELATLLATVVQVRSRFGP